jgi:hypothetical protein
VTTGFGNVVPVFYCAIAVGDHPWFVEIIIAIGGKVSRRWTAITSAAAIAIFRVVFVGGMRVERRRWCGIVIVAVMRNWTVLVLLLRNWTVVLVLLQFRLLLVWMMRLPL